MTDPFEHFDGAYVLGALDDADREAFEQHLPGCIECRQRVAELAELPGLLAGVSLAEVLEEDAGPVPDTLLPGLVREVRRSRTRRTVLSVLGAAAAACAAALIAVAATGSTPGTGGSTWTPPSAAQMMHPVGQSPVHAAVVLAALGHGTRVTVYCHYDSASGGEADYGLTAIDRNGNRHALGSWWISPGENLTYVAPTALARQQIRQLAVTDAAGTPILRVNV
ncbi:MAG TPA: zf-HC2 domain-containing protein [Jatrophihabitans sp.]|nr:zf-HC2 domain-containing protein [Jatrophihabitans sp.]